MRILSNVGSMSGEPVIKSVELWGPTNDADLVDNLICHISEFQMEGGIVVIRVMLAKIMDKNLIIEI